MSDDPRTIQARYVKSALDRFAIRVSDIAEAEIARYLQAEPYPDAAHIREIVRSVGLAESKRLEHRVRPEYGDDGSNP